MIEQPLNAAAASAAHITERLMRKRQGITTDGAANRVPQPYLLGPKRISVRRDKIIAALFRRYRGGRSPQYPTPSWLWGNML